jgi:enoyl-CoA hydratase/carnithine racemase
MLEIVDHGPVRELRLARPPVNALDPGLIGALRAGLAAALADGRDGIVLSGAPGRFSGGLDLPVLVELDRAGMRDVWTAFFGLLRDLATCPVPLVAALTGHSPAGGTVLALFADRRVFADGAFVMGLNEVRVGLPVPDVLLRALAFVVGEGRAAQLATSGALVGPAEALRLGLVDEVAPAAEVVPRAVAWATEIAGLTPGPTLATRALARRPLVRAFEDFGGAQIEQIVELWFAPDAQKTLRAIAARLGKSAKP